MRYLFVQTRFYLKKGSRSEFYRRFRDNNIRELSASEDGNLGYEFYLPLDSDDDVCLLEKWKDLQSQETHAQTLHSAILSEIIDRYVKKIESKRAWLEEIEADEESVSL